jgi:hypothetical protein
MVKIPVHAAPQSSLLIYLPVIIWQEMIACSSDWRIPRREFLRVNPCLNSIQRCESAGYEIRQCLTLKQLRILHPHLVLEGITYWFMKKQSCPEILKLKLHGAALQASLDQNLQ